MGILSSLQPQNVRLRRAIRDLDVAGKHPLYPLLFDPQTAGGLLASVPGSEAEACVRALHAGGYPQAALIGFVTERAVALEPITLDLIGTRLGDFLRPLRSAPKADVPSSGKDGANSPVFARSRGSLAS